MHTIAKPLRLAIMLLLCANAQAGMGPQQRLQQLSERISASSDAPELYLRRALIYAEVGEYRLAFADVDSAAQLGHTTRSQFVRGVLLYRLGQIDQALPLFDAYLDAHPQDPAATLYRARMRRDSGQLEAALEDYLSYLKLRPEAEPGDTLMAARLIVNLAGQGHANYRIDDALALLDEQRRLRGHGASLQRYAIELESARCHSAEALDRLQALHANARRSPSWHLQLAEQLLLQGRMDQASQSLAQAEQRLHKRRPSASKAELEHRLSFLRVVIDNSTQQGLDNEEISAALTHYYPPQNSPPHHPHRHDHGASHSHAVHSHGEHHQAHSHDTLQGFEQPQLSETGYAPQWRENLSAFVACLTRQ